jgi:hypothetical protein
MTTIIRAAGPARFLSLVPHLLGFAPSRSLVLVPFEGRRSIGAMRFDLPDGAEDDEIDRMAATCVGMVCRLADADAVALVVYGGEAVRPLGALPHEQLVRAVTRRADACGLELRDALCVAVDAWASYLDPTVPPTLHDLAELIDDADGPPLASGDQRAGSELPEVSDADAAQTATALAAFDKAIRALTGDDSFGAKLTRDATAESAPRSDRLDPRALEAAVRLDEIPAVFEEALRWDAASMPGYDAATLIWCLSRPALRDIALVQWSGDADDGEAALDAQLRWEDGEEYPVELGMRMWGEGPRPRTARLFAALAVARQAAALAPRAERPGALAACAWLAWASGRSTHAESYARRACEIEPEHGLSEIVLSFVAVGHLPEWAFQPPRPPARAPKKKKSRSARRR